MSRFFSCFAALLLIVGAVVLQTFSLSYGGAIEGFITNYIGWGALILAFLAGSFGTCLVMGEMSPT
jgi:hypothetical protein